MTVPLRAQRRIRTARLTECLNNLCISNTGSTNPCVGMGMDMLTANSHAVAPVERIPHHGAVCNWDECLWKVFRIRGKGSQRRSGAAQNERLKARRRHCGVRHGDRIDLDVVCISLQLSPEDRRVVLDHADDILASSLRLDRISLWCGNYGVQDKT